MNLRSNSFDDGQPMPGRCAFAVPHPDDHVRFADNRNPHLAWSDVPEGVQSFALVCIDPDAPTVPDDVNQEGRTVPADLPRGDFAHWAMIDLPAQCREIDEGACSQGVTAGGKQAPDGPDGARQGINDYTSWFEGDADMAGTYRGYDGPCPPWNDERIHRYVFTVLALSRPTLDLPEDFGAADVMDATRDCALASARLTGTYTLNTSL